MTIDILGMNTDKTMPEAQRHAVAVRLGGIVYIAVYSEEGVFTGAYAPGSTVEGYPAELHNITDSIGFRMAQDWKRLHERS